MKIRFRKDTYPFKEGVLGKDTPLKNMYPLKDTPLGVSFRIPWDTPLLKRYIQGIRLPWDTCCIFFYVLFCIFYEIRDNRLISLILSMTL